MTRAEGPLRAGTRGPETGQATSDSEGRLTSGHEGGGVLPPLIDYQTGACPTGPISAADRAGKPSLPGTDSTWHDVER